MLVGRVLAPRAGVARRLRRAGGARPRFAEVSVTFPGSGRWRGSSPPRPSRISRSDSFRAVRSFRTDSGWLIEIPSCHKGSFPTIRTCRMVAVSHGAAEIRSSPECRSVARPPLSDNRSKREITD